MWFFFQGLCDSVRPDHPGERRVHRSGWRESNDLQLGMVFPGSLPAGDPAEALCLRTQNFLLKTQLLELVRTSWWCNHLHLMSLLLLLTDWSWVFVQNNHRIQDSRYCCWSTGSYSLISTGVHVDDIKTWRLEDLFSFWDQIIGLTSHDTWFVVKMYFCWFNKGPSPQTLLFTETVLSTTYW